MENKEEIYINSAKPIDGVCPALLSEYTTFNRAAFNYYAKPGMKPYEILQEMAKNNQEFDSAGRFGGHHLIYTYEVDGVKYYRAGSKKYQYKPYRFRFCGPQAYYSKEDPGYSDLVFENPGKIALRNDFYSVSSGGSNDSNNIKVIIIIFALIFGIPLLIGIISLLIGILPMFF